MKRILFIAFFICCALQLYSADLQEAPVRLDIREAEKQIYTVESPISLQLHLRNQSAAPYLFELAANKVFNIELEVTNLYNEGLPASEKYIKEKSSKQQVYYRDIRLLPEEEFSFYIQVDDFISIDAPGIYFIRAKFHPNLGTGEALISNTLTVHIHPSGSDKSELKDIIDMEVDQVLKREQLPPDEVIEYMLTARQQEEWDKFILYLDVEQLMLQNRLKEAEYRRSSEQERVRMVNEYRTLLQNEEVENDILIKPVDFTVVKTVYTAQEAEVLVDEEFRYPDYTEKRHYLYYLHRLEGYWTIYKYQVLGQETR